MVTSGSVRPAAAARRALRTAAGRGGVRHTRGDSPTAHGPAARGAELAGGAQDTAAVVVRPQREEQLRDGSAEQQQPRQLAATDHPLVTSPSSDPALTSPPVVSCTVIFMVSAELEPAGSLTMMQSASAGDPLAAAEAGYLRGMAGAGAGGYPPHPEAVLPHHPHPHMQVSAASAHIAYPCLVTAK